MRIAVIGHKYHGITGSAQFFLELLGRFGAVEVLLDDSLDGAEAVDLGTIGHDYDLIVVWQIEYVVPLLLKKGIGPLVFVPMYDGCMGLPDNYWRSLSRTKILCFSARLYEKLQRLGCNCIYARYAIDPKGYPVTSVAEKIKGFYWYRRNVLSPAGLNDLVRDLGIGALTIQYMPDPSESEVYAKDDYQAAMDVPVTFLNWTNSKQQYLNQLIKSQVYFAPRANEGIGMSFLEAMAMGMVVVAPDNPTMNEYIIHGHNGLLYSPENGELLDNSYDLARISSHARLDMLKGAEEWGAYQNFLLQWLVDKASGPSFFYDKILQAPQISDNEAACMADKHSMQTERQIPNSKVTIVTVVKNAADSIQKTMESVLSQTYPEIEYIALDGVSTDGTQQVIEPYLNRIDHYLSEPDQGTYDAMNKAARLATGRWILFMNAGDCFLFPNSLTEFMENAPEEADFIIGHHVYERVDGGYELHPVNDFGVTYNRLLNGNLDGNWMRGIPGHQATVTRTVLLAEKQYDLSYRIAADHEFMYRCKRNGAVFHWADSYLSCYQGGGGSWVNAIQCIEEWRKMALKYTKNPKAIRRFYATVLEHHHINTLVKMGIWSAIKYMVKHPDAARVAFFSYKYLKQLPGHIFSKLLGSQQMRRTNN